MAANLNQRIRRHLAALCHRLLHLPLLGARWWIRLDAVLRTDRRWVWRWTARVHSTATYDDDLRAAAAAAGDGFDVWTADASDGARQVACEASPGVSNPSSDLRLRYFFLCSTADEFALLFAAAWVQ